MRTTCAERTLDLRRSTAEIYSAGQYILSMYLSGSVASYWEHWERSVLATRLQLLFRGIPAVKQHLRFWLAARSDVRNAASRNSRSMELEISDAGNGMAL